MWSCSPTAALPLRGPRLPGAGRRPGGDPAAVNIVDPSTVVLGGLYAALEPWLNKPLLEELRERAIALGWSPVRLLASRLGPDAAVRGAAGAVVKRVLSEPEGVFHDGRP